MTLETTQQIAVIYCRVSAKSQTKRGDGLGSQYTRCFEYAKGKGYTIVAEFHDDFTGKSVKRPGFNQLLKFVRKHKAQKCIVLIDDISRLARDVESHWELRRTIRKAGGELEAPSLQFNEDADSRMIENTLAGVAQHFREKNAEQTYNRRRARLMNGYWVFSKPKGYEYIKAEGGGHKLVRDEPVASIVQEALEGFANARFETQVEVKRFLEAQPDFPKDLPNGKITSQRITDILKQPLYAGYLASPPLDVPLRKAKHEGLISFATFEKIQQRLTKGARAPMRKDISKDFVLRGHVLCADCNKPLTACWSTSKTGKKHPYYYCYTKGCDSRSKMIRRDKLESEFETVIQSLQPSKACVGIVNTMFKTAWEHRLAQAKQALTRLKEDAVKIEKQIDQLLSRIVESDEESVIKAYEKKIATLQKQKLLAQEKLENRATKKQRFEDLFELALKFLSNPYDIWVSGQLPIKKLVLRLAFNGRIAYHREKGYSNPLKSLPFNMLGDLFEGQMEMARPERFELPTLRFEA